MSIQSTLANTNAQIRSLLDQSQLANPQLKTLLKQAKLLIYSSGNLHQQNPAFVHQSAIFAQLNLRFILASRSSREYQNAINTVKFFQENQLLGQNAGQRRDKLTAIHLLFLLSTNRTQEFYSKLESITTQQLQQAHIAYVLRLNDAIQEGNYGQISTLRKDNPLPQQFGPFLDSISETIKIEIARSAQKAYSHLTLKEALVIFDVKSVDQLREFAEKYQADQEEPQATWSFRGDYIYFERDTGKSAKFNSEELIKKTLDYSVELERIA